MVGPFPRGRTGEGNRAWSAHAHLDNVRMRSPDTRHKIHKQTSSGRPGSFPSMAGQAMLKEGCVVERGRRVTPRDTWRVNDKAQCLTLSPSKRS